jgi:translation initiation factor IF-2
MPGGGGGGGGGRGPRPDGSSFGGRGGRGEGGGRGGGRGGRGEGGGRGGRGGGRGGGNWNSGGRGGGGPSASGGGGNTTIEIRRPAGGAPRPFAASAPGAPRVAVPQLNLGEDDDNKQQDGDASTPAPVVGQAVGRLGIIEVVEEDAEPGASFDDGDARPKKPSGGAAAPASFNKGRGSPAGGRGASSSSTNNARGKGRGPGRREKVTAEMKRAARQSREQERLARLAAGRREREEIFEVGESGMSLEDLAAAIQVDPSEVVRTLFMKGIVLSMNQVLDKNTVKLVAAEYDLLVVDKDEAKVEDGARKSREFVSEEDVDDLQPRPPVVTVMGHVDHGKTSLLDFIRKSRVAAGEAGGITQSIGAYNVDVELDGRPATVCFLDTPGHEAFSAMRARGARVTDVAVVVVAADDGVRPQTREAVAHARAADVPIVVAINKIDKPGADVERTKQGLLELELVPEEWGGTTTMVPISAKKGTGIEDLLTAIAWTAEERSLVANPNRPAAGTVVEAHLDRRRGAVATLLVQAGTLKVGDVLASGACYGKVRALSDGSGKPVQGAGPSIAVQMVGLNAVPQAGDEFQAYSSEPDARAAADAAMSGMRAARLAEMGGTGSMVTLSSLATVEDDDFLGGDGSPGATGGGGGNANGDDALQRLNVIIKADTSGMVEAIKGALSALPQQSVALRYLLCAAGDVSTSDVDLAAASGGMILAFNLSPDEAVLAKAKSQGVSLTTHKVIYELIDSVTAAMEGRLKVLEAREELGRAVVKAVFAYGKLKVAGCGVEDGKLVKGVQAEVLRPRTGGSKGAPVSVHKGAIVSLRRVKDAVEEVAAGLECGVGVEGFSDWKEGDIISCFRLVPKTQRLAEARAATAVDLATIGA